MESLKERLKNYTGMERISSAPRLSISGQDVFNLRNQNLSSRLSRSTPGIYSPQRKAGLNLSQQQINLIAATPPKGILIKPTEEPSIVSERIVEEEKEEKRSLYKLRLELQFSAFVFLCFVFVIVIPLSMIIIGSVYVYSCPIEIMIPIFLIVGGSSFLSSTVLLRRLNKLAKERYEDETCFKRTLLMAVLFQLGWFIAGCYWIYGAFRPDYVDENSSAYCHKTLYLYSFWFLNAIFLTLTLFAVTFAVYIIFGRGQAQEIPNTV